VGGALLAQFGRGQVDGDAAHGQVTPDIAGATGAVTSKVG
jgi:hypothetical protein